MPQALLSAVEIQHSMSPLWLMILGSAGLYLASRAAVDALTIRTTGRVSRLTRLPSPAMMALGQCMPIAAVAGLSAVRGRADIALGVVFGSAVATLSLALGLTTVMAPLRAIPGSRRAWPVLLFGAIVPLLTGFAGVLTPVTASTLLILGAAALTLWRPPSDQSADGLEAASAVPREKPIQPFAVTAIRCLQWTAAVAVAFVAADSVMLGTTQAQMQSRVLQPALLAAAILSPMLILPVLASGSDLAHQGRTSDAVSSLLALSMMILFVLLPIVILVWFVRSASGVAPLLKDPLAIFQNGMPIPFPLHLWRVDTVLLMVLALALVPVSLGRIVLGRAESTALVIVYAIYLYINAKLALTWTF